MTILSTKGLTRSQGAKSTEYPAVQADTLPSTTDTTHPTLFFLRSLRLSRYFILSLRDISTLSVTRIHSLPIKTSNMFGSYAAMVGSVLEVPRNAEIRKRLTRILQLPDHEEPNTDKTSGDGVHMITVDYGEERTYPSLDRGAQARARLWWLRSNYTSGYCHETIMDSTRRESVYVTSCSNLTILVYSQRAEIRDRCCYPTLMLTGGGPWLGVMGGVFTDRFIVQRLLTSLMWIAESSTEEDARIYDTARVFVALRKSLEQLTTFYEKIGEFKIPRVIKAMAVESASVDKQTLSFFWV